MDSFNKHTIRKHLNEKDNYKKCTLNINIKENQVSNTVILEYINNNNINNQSTETNIFECENVITPMECSYSKICSIDDAINSIYQSAIDLTMLLHNNNNFSRKDVINIQK